MRKRSGGLHCQNTEELLQLAQFSQNNIGLYYDDAINLKHSNKKSNINSKLKKDTNKQEEKSQKKTTNNNTFAGFDFNEEIAYKEQELRQLNHQKNKNIKNKNFLIICSDPSKQRATLASCFQMLQYYKQKISNSDQLLEIITQFLQLQANNEIVLQQQCGNNNGKCQNFLNCYQQVQKDKDLKEQQKDLFFTQAKGQFERILDLFIHKKHQLSQQQQIRKVESKYVPISTSISNLTSTSTSTSILKNQKNYTNINKYWFLKKTSNLALIQKIYYQNAEKVFQIIPNQSKLKKNYHLQENMYMKIQYFQSSSKIERVLRKDLIIQLLQIRKSNENQSKNQKCVPSSRKNRNNYQDIDRNGDNCNNNNNDNVNDNILLN